jgi:hypothetical protein
MFMDELRRDLRFIRGHKLQPGWFKILKIFILIGITASFLRMLGLLRTVVWLLLFMSLALVVHLVYRVKTNVFTQSWMDFRVTEENGERVYERIGLLYYSLVVAAFALATVIAWLV